MAKLTLTTAALFEEIMTQDDVDVKHTTTGPEYVTAVYQNGSMIAERVLYVAQAEHFVVARDEEVRETRKPLRKLP
ncbi:hypothetical protein NVP1081O_057 [Vibrio phage 1.081.O._10N.286.52.C2]|nr:hypothetical protein NVP1081O_057 [Vibrio phage 1.081.O._10N.286.52.C2]